MTLRVLDLFSGIGGFSLGLERAGMKTVAFCEIEPYCRAVLRKHWPDVPIHEDIRTREFTEGEADVICGGFPCQDISSCRTRCRTCRRAFRALAGVMYEPFAWFDQNTQSWRTCAALLGRGFGRSSRDLASIGYDAEWDCIPAHAAVGAPHPRDRIWIIAYPRGQQRHKAIALRTKGRPLGEISKAIWPTLTTRDYKTIRQHSSSECSSERLLGRAVHQFRTPRTSPRTAMNTMARPSGNGRLNPSFGRVVMGFPIERTDLNAGNAVVPAIPEIIGRAILAAEEAA